LPGSANTSSGNKYSSPAGPKFTRISLRPIFSMALTNVPSRGKRTPVFCERIGLMVFNESPGFMSASIVWVPSGLVARRFLLDLMIVTFIFLLNRALSVRRFKQQGRCHRIVSFVHSQAAICEKIFVKPVVTRLRSITSRTQLRLNQAPV
jgi:hypothetical protein